jgi:hypothetical protein
VSDLVGKARALRQAFQGNFGSYALPLVGYLALLFAAWPQLLLNFSSAIPGTIDKPDYAPFYWNIWWFQHAIFNLHHSPYFTNYVFFPHVMNLAFHNFVPLLGAVAIPVYAIFGITIAFNCVIVGSLLFSGLAMWLLLRHHKIPDGLAFLGGALFVFSAFITARLSNNELDMLPIGWLPLGVLALDRLVEQRSWRTAVTLSLVLYLAVMTGLQFAMWLALLLAPYALVRLVQLDARLRLKAIGWGMLAAVLLAALTMIAPLPQLLADRTVDYPRTSLREAEQRSLQVGDLIAWPPRFFDAEHISLGLLLPIGLAASVLRRNRGKLRFAWLFIGLMCLILSLGPTLERLNWPLPYRLIYQLSQGSYRAPDRFLLPALCALIVFVMLSLRADYERLGSRGRRMTIGITLLLLAFENRWYEPFPVFTMPDYRIYHAIGAESDEYLVLEVPVGVHNTVADIFGPGANLQYYATVHHKQLINGRLSRAPSGTSHDYRQWPLITALAEEGPLPEEAVARQEFRQLSDDWDIRYAIIHRDMLTPEVSRWATGFFNTQAGWCLVDEQGPVLAYHRLAGSVCPTAGLLDPPDTGTINIGDGADDRYLGTGWYLSENVGGPQARWTGGQPTAELRVHLMPRSYRVTIQATAYVPTETVAISVNGQPLIDLPISAAGWGAYTVDVPAHMIPADGLVTFAFTPAQAQSAFERTQGQVDDKRPLAVAFDSINFAATP